MAKERLSKLQKWILKTAYESGEKSISKEDIYKLYFDHPGYYDRYSEMLKADSWYKKRGSHRVILSRSLNVLESRSLVKLNKWRGRWADVELTKEGISRACGLQVASSLNVNTFPRKGINNKKKTARPRKRYIPKYERASTEFLEGKMLPSEGDKIWTNSLLPGKRKYIGIIVRTAKKGWRYYYVKKPDGSVFRVHIKDISSPIVI